MFSEPLISHALFYMSLPLFEELSLNVVYEGFI